MDSPHRVQTGEWRFPIATCVVFLSEAVGGPTLILDQTRDDGKLAGRGWLVRPDRPGTVYCFDSTLLHGVMPAFSEDQKVSPVGCLAIIFQATRLGEVQTSRLLWLSIADTIHGLYALCRRRRVVTQCARQSMSSSGHQSVHIPTTLR